MQIPGLQESGQWTVMVASLLGLRQRWIQDLWGRAQHTAFLQASQEVLQQVVRVPNLEKLSLSLRIFFDSISFLLGFSL